jgi:hypothetical protein
LFKIEALKIKINQPDTEVYKPKNSLQEPMLNFSSNGSIFINLNSKNDTPEFFVDIVVAKNDIVLKIPELRSMVYLLNYLGEYATNCAYRTICELSKPVHRISDFPPNNRVENPTVDDVKLAAERSTCIRRWWIYCISRVINNNEKLGVHAQFQKKNIASLLSEQKNKAVTPIPASLMILYRKP